MGKEIATEVQEAQRVPYRINPRRNIPRHILIKLSKIKYKEKILKAAREKQQITKEELLSRIKNSKKISKKTTKWKHGQYIYNHFAEEEPLINL